MTPCWKQAFDSPHQAMTHAINGGLKAMRAYQCPHCRKIHLTSQETLPARKRAAMDTRQAR
jgi:hypothetical protein